MLPLAAKRAITARVSSLELLSTTTTSYDGGSAWHTSAVSASTSRDARLYVHSTTEISTAAGFDDRAAICVLGGLGFGFGFGFGAGRQRSAGIVSLQIAAIEPAGEVPDRQLARGACGGRPAGQHGADPGERAAKGVAVDIAR